MDISNLKVSIITPTHNDEKYVKKTIESILGQTHKNIELIVVDDFSTDLTVQVIESFHDERIRLFINDSNKGAAYSRNLAISKATGDYVAFLDGDDVWNVNKLEEQLKFMIEHNYSFTCTYYSMIDENDGLLGITTTAPKKITHRKFLKMSYVGCSTVIYRRNIYPDLSIPNGIKKRNDYALWLKLSEKSTCYSLNKCLTLYRQRTSDSISSGSKTKLVKYHKELFQQIYNFGSLKATFYAIRNIFYYILKQLLYVKMETNK